MKTNIDSAIQSKTTMQVVVMALACLGLSPMAQATDLGGALPNGNTADGTGVLVNLTTGIGNSGFGLLALTHDTSGNYNTADGSRALANNSTGSNNTANGYGALFRNNGQSGLGFNNTATGFEALFSNTTGFQNTAGGSQALFSNPNGGNSTAVGFQALRKSTTISGLVSDTNTAVGAFALANDTTGGANVAIGYNAGINLTTGDGNIVIGTNVAGVAGESFVTRIGNIGGNNQATGITVTLDAVGGTKLGYVVTASSRRYKEDIKPMEDASEALYALKPVSFRYKHNVDPDPAERFGLIAEEVEKIKPDLVVRDQQGRPNVVRYDSINAMLLNEFLKEHRKVEDQGGTIAELKKEIAALAATVKKQAAQIQKVGTDIEVSKTGPQVASSQ